ncbi:hypothetical protein DL765_011079 [Monosporascus sp. GIB2]|nr:hypothetical protein DL765_011079 [Monosporascus sp. GIB2]
MTGTWNVADSTVIYFTLKLKMDCGQQASLFHNSLMRSSVRERYEEDSKNWKTAGIRIEGPASWQMAYQAAIFYLIPFWEREWASCLDELDNSVRVKVRFNQSAPTGRTGPQSANATRQMEDIMDPDTKNSMMFDASLIRSRFYFEVIQMLRIFSDMIRETGRDLQTMVSDPNMASHLSWKDDQDEALRENSKRILRVNWDVIEARQKDAEKRLLDRLMGLSGDMQSLRDGLFNATALLEASRSTAMARYVFAFTVTVFSTQFFNKTEMADTIAVYRDSTVAVALVTYAVAIIMICLADRLGLIRQLWIPVVPGVKAMVPRMRYEEQKLQEKDTALDNAVV